MVVVVVVVVVLSVCDLFPSQNRSLTPNKNASPQNLVSSYVFMNILLCSALVSYHAKPRWFCNVCREMGVLRSRVERVWEGMESRNHSTLLQLLYSQRFKCCGRLSPVTKSRFTSFVDTGLGLISGLSVTVADAWLETHVLHASFIDTFVFGSKISGSPRAKSLTEV